MLLMSSPINQSDMTQQCANENSGADDFDGVGDGHGAGDDDNSDTGNGDGDEAGDDHGGSGDGRRD